MPYRVWERGVPRIRDAFTGIAAYIYPTLEDAQCGEAFGGSGFLVTMPFETNREWYFTYAVTNRHVVARAGTPVLRLNRKDGVAECVPTRADQWVFHPDGDDVAVMAIDIQLENFRLTAFTIKDFVTRQRIIDEDIGIGDDTVMVGRFINHDGRQQNAPAVRFGNIAMMNREPIINKETGTAQESFLVEVRSLPGYSGSAVLLWSPCAMNDMSQRRFGSPKPNSSSTIVPGKTSNFSIRQTTSPKGPYLLGIDWCHILRNAKILSRDGRPIDEGWYVEENTGMAGVIPAWKIAEVLNGEELMAQRQKADEEITKRKAASAASLDYADREKPPFTKADFEDALTKASRKLDSDK